MSVSFLERLSSQYHWVDRAAAWDQECDLQTRVRLSDQLEQMQRRHLQIADVALAKISTRLNDLDPKDIRVADIPRLLSAILEIQAMLFPAPTEMRQPGVITATQIRLLLREEKSLSTREHEPQPSVSPRLVAWVRGDDLDIYDHEHE